MKIFKYINDTEIGIPNVTFELRRADEQPIQGQSSILLTSNEASFFVESINMDLANYGRILVLVFSVHTSCYIV
ncbi:hypothetical protein EfmAA818_22680 [Enterococcus faecium]|nr:hypothetical protein EfmAA818_22680 [Enterococcus faecium]